MPTAYALRDYQQRAVDEVRDLYRDWLQRQGGTGRLQRVRRMYAAPTGSGKGVTINRVAGTILAGGYDDCAVIVPTLEIGLSVAMKRNDVEASRFPRSQDGLAAALQRWDIWTVQRLKNAVARGEAKLPRCALFDEVHHAEADTWRWLLDGIPFAIGFTATPYRGNPVETLDLREKWGDAVELLTWREGVERGYISQPTCRIMPLVDDDEIEISNGQFVVKRVEAAHGGTQLRDLAWAINRDWQTDPRPTIVFMPGLYTAGQLCQFLERFGTDPVLVDAGTDGIDRAQAFDDVVNCRRVLVNVAVVTEGVDLPLRRLYDARPLCSPLAWAQMVGRITRPCGGCENPPEYICTNRNLERHGYLFDGMLPPLFVREAQEAFGEPSANAQAARFIGIESVGRFKPLPLPLRDGSTGWLFNVYSTDARGRTVEYVVMCSPHRAKPVVARREREASRSGRMQYGRWQACALPADLKGFATSRGTDPATPAQLREWRKMAALRGLDADAADNEATPLKRRQVEAAFVLRDLRERLVPR